VATALVYNYSYFVIITTMHSINERINFRLNYAFYPILNIVLRKWIIALMPTSHSALSDLFSFKSRTYNIILFQTLQCIKGYLPRNYFNTENCSGQSITSRIWSREKDDNTYRINFERATSNCLGLCFISKLRI
jgi:hypothetical protein